MENLVEGELGPDAKYEVSFADGMLKIEVKYKGDGGSAGIVIEGDAIYLIDKITDAIPGEWDDALLDSLAQKLLSKKTA